MDKEGMLQFTICILDKFQRANTENFDLVACERQSTRPSTSASSDAEKSILARDAAVFGEVVKSLSYTTIFLEIETCKEKVCKLELLLLEVEDWDNESHASDAA